MNKFIFRVAFLLMTIIDHTLADEKQSALAALEFFFGIEQQRLEFNGSFHNTDDDFGRKCKIIADLSRPGAEYLTLAGEHTPGNNIGEGVFFNEQQNVPGRN